MVKTHTGRHTHARLGGTETEIAGGAQQLDFVVVVVSAVLVFVAEQVVAQKMAQNRLFDFVLYRFDSTFT